MKKPDWLLNHSPTRSKFNRKFLKSFKYIRLLKKSKFVGNKLFISIAAFPKSHKE